MLYMVIEHFHDGAGPEVYRRAREKGRMFSPGLEYVASWGALDFKPCYQLMRTDDPALFAVWTENWKDLSSFMKSSSIDLMPTSPVRSPTILK